MREVRFRPVPILVLAGAGRKEGLFLGEVEVVGSTAAGIGREEGIVLPVRAEEIDEGSERGRGTLMPVEVVELEERGRVMEG